jgi:cytochrome c oxidase subunit 2
MEKLLRLPVLASKHGQDVDNFIIYVHYLMIALFVGWMAYFVYVLFRFNRWTNPKADHGGLRSHASNYIEGAVVVVEAILLCVFAIPLWARQVDQFPTAEQHPTHFRIIAQQFNWNVFFPGVDGEFGKRDISFVTTDNPWGADKNDPKGKDDFSVPEGDIHVPVGKPVIIDLTSKDVIHSFKVIAMRTTQDAIPGLSIPLYFTPTKVGIYQINCAQLCGIGHSTMAGGRIKVDTQEDYDKWFAEQAKKVGKTAGSFE